MTVAPDTTSGEQLVLLVRRYRRAMADALAGEGRDPLPPGPRWLMLAVDRAPGTVGELAERLEISKQEVSRMADRLVRAGYCERTRSSADRREVWLRATPDGIQAATLMRAAIATVQSELLERLPEGDRGGFLAMLEALTNPEGSAEA